MIFSSIRVPSHIQHRPRTFPLVRGKEEYYQGSRTWTYARYDGELPLCSANTHVGPCGEFGSQELCSWTMDMTIQEKSFGNAASPYLQTAAFQTLSLLDISVGRPTSATAVRQPACLSKIGCRSQDARKFTHSWDDCTRHFISNHLTWWSVRTPIQTPVIADGPPKTGPLFQ